MIDAITALERLREGNQRFARGESQLAATTHLQRLGESIEGQAPIAVILGCSDSRVPVEIIFDQGLGDLFVIRVAGNVVAASQVGSVEFAAANFGTRLVVVLGHSHCGAIEATLDVLTQPGTRQSRNLRSIVERIHPAVAELVELDLDRETRAHHAERANVRVAANQLRHGSEILEELIESNGLVVVGAHYSLDTGLVDFFDGAPGTAG